eukprot:5541399-Ditylum_brightwellii.AAC.1
MDQHASSHGIIEELLGCLVIFRVHLGQRLLWVLISVPDSPINPCCFMKEISEELSNFAGSWSKADADSPENVMSCT